MSVSLHSFCKEHNLPKSSVYRRAQELNIPTSDGLSEQDCDRLLQEFGVTPVIEATPIDHASTSAIIPVVHTVEVVSADSALVARKIQPQVVGYDTSDLKAAAALNVESLDFNVNAMGSQLVEQMKQLGKLHAAQARQAYAHTVASELGTLGMKPGQE